MPDLTLEQIDELERLHQAATPGPWELKENSAQGKDEAWCYWHKIGPVELTGIGPDSNSAMLLAVRNALPALLSLARRAKQQEAEQTHASNAYNTLESVTNMQVVEIDRLRSDLDALRKRLGELHAKLQKIVCTEPPDDGVVLLSNEGPCHWDAEAGCNVYDHEHFSPLGDALMEMHEILTKALADAGG